MHTRKVILAALCVSLTTCSVGAAAPVQPTLGGWGERENNLSVPCLTDEQRADIQARVAASRNQLRSRGLLAPESASGTHVTFGWPLKLRADLTDPGYHGISNFVDQDANFPNQLLDYDCGTRSYDLSSGYNHQGIDYFTWPFGWYKMDHDEVEIVAAAAGTIVYKSDGNYDRNCGFGGGDWNAVYVEHEDLSVAWYGHMKSGSTTSKPVGATVAKGEYLGVVGSSGSSTGPHLHLEIYGPRGLIDPYFGACNPTTPDSWWDSQRPYYDSALNAVLTHDAPPSFPSCPQAESPNDEIYFRVGNTAYFAAYYRDQLFGQVSNYAVYDAANNVVASWNHSSGAPHYSGSFWYWYFSLPSGFSLGWWRFDVTYQSTTVSRSFFVAPPLTDAGDDRVAAALELSAVTPNPVSAGARFDFALPVRGPVSLVLIDGQGRQVTELGGGDFGAGRHSVTWDGRGAGGDRVAPGLYFAQLSTRAGRVARKVIVAE